jgi:putative Holliday junction resolvase
MNTAVQPMTHAHLHSFLAFDVGLKRTGVAYASRLLGQAQPQGSVHASGDARWPLLAEHIQRWQPDALVVGVPYHPDGTAHDNTVFAQKFARQLRGRFSLPVFEVDERYSTTEAKHLGNQDIDAASACVILDQFLRTLTP